MPPLHKCPFRYAPISSLMDIQIMNWYGIKLLYVNNVVGEAEDSLVDDNYTEGYIAYEESIVVFQADSFDMAYEKAEQFAKENEDDYQNIYGQTIQVRYYDAVDSYLIDEIQELKLQDGVEVYSRIIESNLKEDQKAFLQRLYPILDGPKHMLLNREFSRSKSDKSA
ncbi:DUF4288 domain-containing protein [Flavisolibacter sp. BT320]|nr:DUF4288 domain-containing protein [Flavisolibacter longurius]